jgi:Ca2+-binding RTX toxin-like protein
LIAALLMSVTAPSVDAQVASQTTGAWQQLGADLDGEGPDDWAGESVAISADGNTAAVAAERNDDQGNNAGHVRVYRFDGTDWTQVGTDIEGESHGLRLGNVVSLSDDGATLAVNVLNGEEGFDGFARVFRFDGTDWAQLGTDIVVADPSYLDPVSINVALSGDGTTVTASAVNYAPNTPGPDDSQTMVLRFDGTDWSPLGNVIAGTGRFDAVSIDADGDTVMTENQVYRYDGSAWNQLGGDLSAPALGQSSMSADGNTVLVEGAEVYRFDGADWGRLGSGAPLALSIGTSGSISGDGNTVVVGESHNDDGGTNAGQARVYAFDGNEWNPVGAPVNGENERDRSGTTAAISDDGSTIIVGAPGNDDAADKAGHARVWRLDAAPVPLCGGLVVTIDMNAGQSGIGTPGRDIILGTPLNDTINSGDGDDVVCGGDGDDVIRTGAGVDRVYGDDGADEIWSGDDDDRVYGGDGDDTIRSGGGNDRVWAGMGIDVAIGGSGDDVLLGGNGDDTLLGRAGNDTINGQLGDDTIEGNNGDDDCDGALGVDTATSCESESNVP